MIISSRIQSVLRWILEFLFWGTFFYYLKGGIQINGTMKFTYMGDLWGICAGFYGLGRLGFGVRFRDTLFGKGFTEFIQATVLSFDQKSLAPLMKMSWVSHFFGLAFLYWIFLFCFIPIFSHWAFGTWVWDIGIIENSIYNFSQTGKFTNWYSTPNWDPVEYMPNNRLNLGLIFFGLLYRLGFQHTEILFLSQSFVLLFSLVPLYLLGKLILPKFVPPWFGCVFFLLWDPIHRINVWDFHEPPFSLFFGLWAFYFIETKKSGRACAALVLMAIWREDAWWTLSVISLYGAFRTRRFGLFIPLALIGFLVFPAFSHFFNKVNSFGSRYGYLGNTMPEAIVNVLSKPWILLERVWINKDFFGRLLWNSGGGLFIFSGWPLLTVLPNLAEVGLSSHDGMLNWNNHYVLTFAAPLFFSTLWGWRKVSLWIERRWGADVARGVISCGLALSLSSLSFNEPGAFSQTLDRYQKTRCYEPLLKSIPEQASLIVSDPVAARMSRRPQVTMPQWDADYTWADYLIIREDQFLNVGVKGRRPHAGWVQINQFCDFKVYKRGN